MFLKPIQVLVLISLWAILSEAKSLKQKKFPSPVIDPAEKHKYVEDPFVFYKWPGFAKAEGLYGVWPWYPAFVIDKTKDEENDDEDKVQEDDDEDKVQEDEKEDEEDEEDEPEDDLDDYFSKHKHHHDHYDEIHYKPYKKQKPVAVSSVGFGPAEGKATWYGVLRPKVQSRSELDLDISSSDSVEEAEDFNFNIGDDQVEYFLPSRSHGEILLLQPQSQEYYQPNPFLYSRSAYFQ